MLNLLLVYLLAALEEMKVPFVTSQRLSHLQNISFWVSFGLGVFLDAVL